ncbi:allose kinase [Rouxiella badensis]|uniref:allose kinase n=1 Tax=Rouxiella badensis TaxID=1646377 RepID=UPI001787962A|nr:allose kinase [Rouxiella badensis]QOI56411.1 allose kinase [Rouxiella badensis subsp. acadiensis]
MRYFLGVDIGGTSTRLMLMDSSQTFHGYRKVATQSWAGLSDPLSGLQQVISDYLQQAGKAEQVARVMLGLPGILSRDRQTVLSLPFIPALDDQPVARLLSERLGLPVVMDKDVNHLMWWDLTRLVQLPDVAVGVYLGTGLGNSLWLNQDFYHGAHGAAGELGHIPLAGNPALCPCGKIGCVETLTSGNWLAGWKRQHAAETAFERLFTDFGEHPDLVEFVDRLGRTIATEMNILDPQYLVLGGGVLSMAGFPLSRLERQIRSHLRGPQPANGLTIVLSGVTDETGCRGACLAAERDFNLYEPQGSGIAMPLRRKA